MYFFKPLQKYSKCIFTTKKFGNKVYNFPIIPTKSKSCQCWPRFSQCFLYLVIHLSWWWTEPLNMRYYIFDRFMKYFNIFLCNSHYYPPFPSIILPNENVTGKTTILSIIFAPSHTLVIIVIGLWTCIIMSSHVSKGFHYFRLQTTMIIWHNLQWFEILVACCCAKCELCATGILFWIFFKKWLKNKG